MSTHIRRRLQRTKDRGEMYTELWSGGHHVPPWKLGEWRAEVGLPSPCLEPLSVLAGGTGRLHRYLSCGSRGGQCGSEGVIQGDTGFPTPCLPCPQVPLPTSREKNWLLQNYMQNTCKPHANCMLTTCSLQGTHLEPHVKHADVIQTTCKHHVNHLHTMCRLYENHMQNLCKPHVNYMKTAYKPYANCMQTQRQDIRIITNTHSYI